MKPTTLSGAKTLPELAAQVNERIVSALRDLSGDDLAPGSVFPRGLLNWRRTDVQRDQNDRTTSETYEVKTDSGTWLRYYFRFTWLANDCMESCSVLDPSFKQIGRWTYFWKSQPGDAGQHLFRIEKVV